MNGQILSIPEFLDRKPGQIMVDIRSIAIYYPNRVLVNIIDPLHKATLKRKLDARARAYIENKLKVSSHD